VRLREKIGQEMLERGPIPFSRFMELCLYDPDWGYYSRAAEQFGRAGDFYTSSDVHAVFGRLLARQFEEMWRLLGMPQEIELLELGPGRGLFAQDVLDWSAKKFAHFFQALNYVLVESSPLLRQKLGKTLSPYIDSGKAKLSPPGVLERTSAPEVPIIVFANEFLDALPVEILGAQGELRIGLENGRFVEVWAEASSRELEFLDRYSVHPEAEERVEVPLVAQQYMASVAELVQRGFVIVVDYGYSREEQLAGRHRGTIMTYRQHSTGGHPYEAPGEQDITAEVNFSALAAAAEQRGMLVEKLLTQSQFLMGIGEPNQFADAFADCRLPQEKAKVTLQLKHLVTPAGMGERFHVLIASKGVEAAEFSELSGLRFVRTEIVR
jgi:SAM-dependent MidA family methyltransferase